MPELPHWSREEYLRLVLAREGGSGYEPILLVAEAAQRSGEVVGFAAGSLAPASVGVAELTSLAVAPEARRQGVALALCGAVLAWCREGAAAEVQLEVRAGSRGAIALYERLGFVAVGRRARYYADPVDDAVLLSLALRGSFGC